MNIFENIKKKFKKSKKAKFIQYTKKAVTAIVVASFIWITWSYILASILVVKYGDGQTLESLSKQVCVTLLGTCLGYFIKAYIENYSKRKADLQELSIKTEILDDVETSDAVG